MVFMPLYLYYSCPSEASPQFMYYSCLYNIWPDCVADEFCCIMYCVTWLCCWCIVWHGCVVDVLCDMTVLLMYCVYCVTWLCCWCIVWHGCVVDVWHGFVFLWDCFCDTGSATSFVLAEKTGVKVSNLIKTDKYDIVKVAWFRRLLDAGRWIPWYVCQYSLCHVSVACVSCVGWVCLGVEGLYVCTACAVWIHQCTAQWSADVCCMHCVNLCFWLVYISDTTRPTAPVQNQQTWKLISAQKMSHNNKDLNHLW